MNSQIYYLKRLSKTLDSTKPYIFWKNTAGIYQGGNLNKFQDFGFSSPCDFIGKSVFQIIADSGSAEIIHHNDNKIMKMETSVKIEEEIILPQGKKIFLSHKFPIYNNTRKVIGLFGCAVDITKYKTQQYLIKRMNESLLNSAKLEIESFFGALNISF